MQTRGECRRRRIQLRAATGGLFCAKSAGVAGPKFEMFQKGHIEVLMLLLC